MKTSSFFLAALSATIVAAKPLPRSPTGKRGLAFNNATLANLFEGYSQVSWAYNWGDTQTGLSSQFEYLPMLYGDPTGNQQWISSWKQDATAAIKAGSKHLLAFNEPDINNLTPAQAAKSYMQYMQPFAGSAKLGAPAVTNGGGQTGLTWLTEFLGNCTSCTIDFVPIHWYCAYNDVSYFTNQVQQAYTAGGKRPLWITEFQGETIDCSAPSTDAQQAQFMRTVLPWLDSLSWLERYAYFGVFETSSSQTYLINSAGNGFSTSGHTFATLNTVNSTTPTSLVA